MKYCIRCKVDPDKHAKPAGFVFWLSDEDLRLGDLGCDAVADSTRLMQIGRSVCGLARASIGAREAV